ncbi:MAG: hypothetical protein ACI4J6_12735 [Oscillospiraceae bacterium]
MNVKIMREILFRGKRTDNGEWIEEDTAVTCPICTRSYDTDFEIKRSVVLGFKYCPECGAKMDNRQKF